MILYALLALALFACIAIGLVGALVAEMVRWLARLLPPPRD